MVKLKEFRWSEQDSKTLLQIVLEHLKKGSTLTKAFEETHKAIGRTPAACSFHYNNYIRKENSPLIEEAKREAKKAKKETKQVENQDENHIKLPLHGEVDNLNTTAGVPVNKKLLDQGSLGILESISKILEEKDAELLSLREENKKLKEENNEFKNTFSIALSQLKKHNA